MELNSAESTDWGGGVGVGSAAGTVGASEWTLSESPAAGGGEADAAAARSRGVLYFFFLSKFCKSLGSTLMDSLATTPPSSAGRVRLVPVARSI